MTYGDVVVIMGRRLKDVEGVFAPLVEQTNQMRLEKMIKFMIVPRKPSNENEYVKLCT